jgi:hypothetical protein
MVIIAKKQVDAGDYATVAILVRSKIVKMRVVQ